MRRAMILGAVLLAAVAQAGTFSQGPADAVTRTSAVIRATVLSAHATNTWTLYYGTFDGGTNSAAWTNSVVTTNVAVGAWSNHVGGLAPASLYYYRFSLVETNATNWAAASSNLITSAGAPTGAAPAFAAVPMMVSTTGVPVSPQAAFNINRLLTVHPAISNVFSIEATAMPVALNGGGGVGLQLANCGVEVTAGNVEVVNGFGYCSATSYPSHYSMWVNYTQLVQSVTGLGLVQTGRMGVAEAGLQAASNTAAAAVAGVVAASGRVDVAALQIAGASNAAAAAIASGLAVSGRVNSAEASITNHTARLGTLEAAPAVGFLFIHDPAPAVTVLSTNYSMITNWTVRSTNAVLATASNMTLQAGGWYDVFFQVSFDGDTPAPHYEVELWTNGAPCDCVAFERDTSSTATGSGSAAGNMYLEPATVLDVRAKSDGANDMAILKAQLKVHLIK